MSVQLHLKQLIGLVCYQIFRKCTIQLTFHRSVLWTFTITATSLRTQIMALFSQLMLTSIILSYKLSYIRISEQAAYQMIIPELVELKLARNWQRYDSDILNYTKFIINGQNWCIRQAMYSNQFVWMCEIKVVCLLIGMRLVAANSHFCQSIIEMSLIIIRLLWNPHSHGNSARKKLCVFLLLKSDHFNHVRQNL